MFRPALRRAACAFLIAAATAAVAASTASGASQQVQVTDNAFVTPAVAITPGEAVTWTNTNGVEHHTVHFEDEQPTTPPIAHGAIPPWTTTRSFTAAGAYRYYCDEHGAPGRVGMSGVVYVNETGTVPGLSPTASFTVSPSVVTVGQSVAVDASASTDPDDAIKRHEWDFGGDGTFEIDSGAQPTASSPTPSPFTTPGTKTVALRVTDATGRTDTTTRQLTVSSPPPPPPPPAETPPPPPAPAPAPAPPAPVLPVPALSPAGDSSAPVVKLAGATRQKAAKTVMVSLSCSSEACTAVVNATVKVPKVGKVKAKTYKLRGVTVKLAKGARRTVRLRLSALSRRAILRALRARRAVSASFTITVSDAAANRRSVKRTVRFRR